MRERIVTHSCHTEPPRARRSHGGRRSPRGWLGALLLLVACRGESDTHAIPSPAEVRALLANGPGSNVAVTSERASDPRLVPRHVLARADMVEKALLKVIATMPRWNIEGAREQVIWATRTTRLFRFVDDLYILIEPHGETCTVYVRSASRVGTSDLQQNRRNIAELWRSLEGWLERNARSPEPDATYRLAADQREPPASARAEGAPVRAEGT
jgi:uncharacterized protein (DUF1499 family)